MPGDENMKAIFPGYYRPTDKEFSELWDKCTFIFDTNVLLDLYRYPRKISSDLINIIKDKKVFGRIWIPYQVAIEYQAERLGTIAEQVERCVEVKDYLKKTIGQLEEWFNSKQLERRHPSIESKGFVERVKVSFGEFIKELEVIEKKQPDVDDEDKIREEIDTLFEGRVGSPPGGQEYLDKIYEQGKERYERKQPPGYMDTDKSSEDERDPFFYKGMLFKREYGDLILWNQIMDEAKSNEKFKNIIFVMNDKKEDWWEEVRGKTIGPRPELFAELSSEVGVSLFYMYTTERFMEYAEKYLGIKVAEESIKQVELYSQLKQSLERRLLQRRSQQIRLPQLPRNLRDFLISRQALEKYSGRVAAETEFATIQAAVHSMMVDNEMQVLPTPVLLAARTQDMTAFPDTSVCGVGKVLDRNGNAYTINDKDGYILYQHDMIADGTQTRLVNYVNTKNTTFWYSADANGAVTQSTTAP